MTNRLTADHIQSELSKRNHSSVEINQMLVQHITSCYHQQWIPWIIWEKSYVSIAIDTKKALSLFQLFIQYYLNCKKEEKKKKKKTVYPWPIQNRHIYNQPKLLSFCLISFPSAERPVGPICSTFRSTIISKWLHQRRPTTHRIVWYPHRTKENKMKDLRQHLK